MFKEIEINIFRIGVANNTFFLIIINLVDLCAAALDAASPTKEFGCVLSRNIKGRIQDFWECVSNPSESGVHFQHFN